MLHTLTIHYPPPELARQAIVFFLEAWVESPTGALFFVPRVVPAFWHGLSRHLLELGTIPAADIQPAPLLPIPTMVLTVLPHSRAFYRPDESRLDQDGISARDRHHHQQAAEAMRGLQPIRVEAGYILT